MLKSNSDISRLTRVGPYLPLDFHRSFILRFCCYKAEANMVERFSESVKEITLLTTDTPIELLKSTNGDFPIFPVFLRQGDTRMINNVEMQVLEVDGDKVRLAFKPSCSEENNSLSLDVSQFNLRDGVIKVGLYGVIAYRGSDKDGRTVFSMAMVPAIDVHSKNYQKQSTRNFAKAS